MKLRTSALLTLALFSHALCSDDYYEVLGLASSANESDIKRAYRQLAIKYHPDKNEDGGYATQMFLKISEAYQVLSDRESRKQYDRSHGFRKQKTFDMNFEELFKPYDVIFDEADSFGSGFKGNMFYQVRDRVQAQNIFHDRYDDDENNRLNKQYMEQKRIMLENTRWFADDSSNSDSAWRCKTVLNVINGQSHMNRICS